MRYTVFSDTNCPLLNISAIGYAFDASVTRFGPGARSSYIIHYVISGKGYFNKTLISAGQGFLITPNMAEHYYPDEKDPWEFLWFVSDDPKMKTIFNLFDSDIFSYENFAEIKALSSFILKNNNSFISGFDLLERFLKIFKPKEISKNTAKSNAEIYIEAAEKYIDLNMQKPITVSELTDFLGVTQPYLFKVFRKYHSKSPKQYIIEQKLNRAKALLTETDLSVTHIANSVGFADVLSFSKCFSLKIGVSPQNYRKNT